MESIFLWIAREAVETAEQREPEMKGSVDAHTNMQHSSITAMIMSAMAAEAFINAMAEENLSRSIWKAVEQLNAVEKWIVVTKLITDKEWDRGKQPFQDFATLLKLRNGLTHYKPKFVEGDVQFERDFTGQLARRYFNAANGMIKGFFEKAGQDVPPAIQPGTLARGIMRVEFADDKLPGSIHITGSGTLKRYPGDSDNR